MTSSPRISRAVTACLLLALLPSAPALWENSTVPRGDFVLYWQGAHAVLARAFNIYSTEGERAIGEMTGRAYPITQTPLLHATVGLLSVGDLALDFRVFSLLAMVSFLAALFLLGRWLSYSRNQILLLLVLVLSCFGPFTSDVLNSNANRLELGLLAGALWCLRRNRPTGFFLSGFVWSFAILFKPVLVLAPGFLFLSRILRAQRRRLPAELAGAAAGGVLGLTVSSLYFGSARCWLDWWRHLRALPLAAMPLWQGNFSLTTIVWTVLRVDVAGIVPPFMAALTAALLVSCLRRGARPALPPPPRDDFLVDVHVASLGCLACLLSSPLVWSHYYLLCVPMIMTLGLTRPDPGILGSRAGLAWHGALALASFAVALDLLPILLPAPYALFIGIAAYSGAWALFGLGLRSLRRLDLRTATRGPSGHGPS